MYIGIYVPRSDGDFDFVAALASADETDPELADELRIALDRVLNVMEPGHIQIEFGDPEFVAVWEDQPETNEQPVRTRPARSQKMALKDDCFPSAEEIRTHVLNYVKRHCSDLWPADEWNAISDHWDINIWLKDHRRTATVYPVHDMQIDQAMGISFDFGADLAHLTKLILEFDVNDIHAACRSLGFPTDWEYFKKELESYKEPDLVALHAKLEENYG